MNDFKIIVGYGICAITGLYGLYMAGKGLLIIGLSAGAAILIDNAFVQ